jgi:predicted enzyme related to lactoylglutathione lyase
MNQGVRTIIYPVKDLARAKALFRTLLGIEPYTDQPYYVGFRVGDQEIVLDPNGHEYGMTAYYDVDDIEQSLQSLVDSGAHVQHQVRNVGGGRLIAVVEDDTGNMIGLRQG